jgi:SpoVK/Ycf46/Vps4 family AAA+-type ATPase
VKHGRLTTKSDLPDSVFAFPAQRKEPLTDARHVRNAVARFDQVIDVSDSDRARAFENIKKAARHYDVELSETDWRELGVRPQPRRKASASEGAQTRMRTGQAKKAARKGAATRKRLGIAGEAARKAANTRRRER